MRELRKKGWRGFISIFCPIRGGGNPQVVQEMFLLEGAGGIYLFWPSKLGCGRPLFRPTSKYILGGGVVGSIIGARV